MAQFPCVAASQMPTARMSPPPSQKSRLEERTRALTPGRRAPLAAALHPRGKKPAVLSAPDGEPAGGPVVSTAEAGHEPGELVRK